jgi:hypothetical protein
MNLANHCFQVCSCGGGGNLGLSIVSKILWANASTYPSGLDPLTGVTPPFDPAAP